jgi:lipopolysaccharide/colanic/teichoic acid biosynthesis glycosyltransferase
MDLVGASAGLIFTAPLLLLMVLLIKLDSSGPVLLTQPRCGLGDRPFRLLKFLTMVVDAEAWLAGLFASSAQARKEYGAYHELVDDSRITRTGWLLRRLSFDELPQLWNIIRGDMRLVGSCLYLPSERSKIGARSPVVLSVLPGLTGSWQIAARNACTFEERVAIDCDCLRSWSLWTDLRLLTATFTVVASMRNAY